MHRILLTITGLIYLTTLFAQPANDECVDALPLPFQQEYCSAIGEFTNQGATASFPDYPACIDEEADHVDVWFTFVAQATDASISIIGDVPLVTGGTLEMPQMILYSEEELGCDTLTEIGCLSPFGNINQVSGIFSGLMPGSTYYINVGGTSTEGTFQLCVNQFNAVPEPSGDCQDGVILCDKSSFAVDFLSGDGNVNDDLGDLLCNEGDCSAGGDVLEANAAWYKWTCDESGTLAFTIDPLGGPSDDIDFLLYELPNGLDDCSNKENIRCMLSGETQGNTDIQNLPCLNATGLSLNDPDELEECGCQPGNNNFAEAIEMVSGRSYALLIMNFSNSGDGFSISFGGTGTFLGPTASFTADLGQACVGETVTFVDNSNSLDPIDSYNWNFGPNAVPASATGPGPHDVFFNRPGNQSVLLAVTTNRGCLVTEIQNELEVICCESQWDVSGTTQPSICPGDLMGSIDITPQTMFAPYQYEWSNGATTEDISGLDAGEYTVTITDESTCSTVRTFNVGGPPAFTFDTLITMPTCDGGQDGVLTLNVGGGTPGYEFNFNSQGFSNNNTITNLPVSTVSVIVRDAAGCEVELDIEVNELVLELDPAVAAIQEPRCNGESNGQITLAVNNGLGPYAYETNGDGLFDDGAVIGNIPAGMYAVEVRDANGCLGSFNFDVPDPPVLEVDLDTSNISCFGQVDGMITATVDGGRPDYNYQWSVAGAMGPFIDGLAAGTYFLTVTDNNGCPNITSAPIIEPGEIFGEIIEIIDNVCFGEDGGSVRLTASGGTPGFEYSIDGQTFQLDSLLTNLPAGDYDLVIMDAEGCFDTVMATITQPAEFIIDAGPDVLIDLGFDTTLNVVSNYSPVDYSWGPDTAQCLNLDCSRVLVGPFNTTTYVVTGINAAGCPAQDQVTVNVVDNKPVYIPNGFSPDGDGINDGFTLFAGPAVESIELLQIFNRWGGLVYESPEEFLPNEASLGWDGTVDGKPVNSAVFVYQFRVRFLNGEVVDYAGDVTVVR
ncbi:hypothetical protein CEQ90_01730 [Lewinellaceae bacterium SD302]|nr:hypothetical protein CEQ90_01730 [Lewinellaceae bacterium SD302]